MNTTIKRPANTNIKLPTNTKLLESQDKQRREELHRLLDQELIDELGFCRPMLTGTIVPDDARAGFYIGSAFHKVTRTDWATWCYKRAIYQYPTHETLELVAKLTASANHALEIGAGNGHLGRLLGVRMSDSGIQDTPEYVAYYKTLGQEGTKPPSCVERLEALEAVRRYNPTTVIGAWITHKWKQLMVSGHINGVEEEAILAHPSVETYIHLGN